MYTKFRLIKNPTIFSDACVSVSSSMNHAIAMNEVPKASCHLPELLKESACRLGWFPDKEMDGLLQMALEIGKRCSDADSICIEPSHVLPCIPKVISRFYPKLKLETMLASFIIKAGCRAFKADFCISKDMISKQEKVCLLVFQVDNTDTSSCIISPKGVNFLLNGVGVPGRTTIDMDNGPQLPSDVTAMLHYGVNLIQAVGNFSGNYIIAVAVMSMISSSECPPLANYIHPVANLVDTDSEVLEMSSQISLKCPISLCRIKTPVKGRLCKHHQCFDYTNFLEMNSRRPSWRCPYCNQSICYPDICVDQNIVKILSEVGDEVDAVVISADGTWKAVLENKDQSPLTSDSDNQMNEEGQKQCEVPTQSWTLSASGSHVALEVNDMCHNSPSLLLASDTNMNIHNVDRATGPTSQSILQQSSVVNGAVSLSHNQQFVDSHGRIQLTASPVQNQILNSCYLQLHQCMAPSSMPVVCRMPSGNPSVLQTQPLPMQSQRHSLEQTARNSDAFIYGDPLSAMSQSIPSAPYDASNYGVNRQQQSSLFGDSSSVSSAQAQLPSLQQSVTNGDAYIQCGALSAVPQTQLASSYYGSFSQHQSWLPVNSSSVSASAQAQMPSLQRNARNADAFTQDGASSAVPQTQPAFSHHVPVRQQQYRSPVNSSLTSAPAQAQMPSLQRSARNADAFTQDGASSAVPQTQPAFSHHVPVRQQQYRLPVNSSLASAPAQAQMPSLQRRARNADAFTQDGASSAVPQTQPAFSYHGPVRQQQSRLPVNSSLASAPAQAQMTSLQHSVGNADAFMQGGASYAIPQTQLDSYYYGSVGHRQSRLPANSSSVSVLASQSMRRSMAQAIASAYTMVSRSSQMPQNPCVNPPCQHQNTPPSSGTSLETPLSMASDQQRGDGLVALASKNWRPSARMKGNLRRGALENAFSEFTESCQANQPSICLPRATTVPDALPRVQGIETVSPPNPQVISQPPHSAPRANQTSSSLSGSPGDNKRMRRS